MENKRKVIDCRWFPSDNNCSLCITGTEKEVLQAATDHAIKSHGHQDTPELRAELRKLLKDEEESTK